MDATRTCRLIAVCWLSLGGACADGAVEPGGPSVEINVAPLVLPGVLGVEYALAVFNANPTPYTGIFDQAGVVQAPLANLVWQQSSVTSNLYGNGPGGDISYVGPCDASKDDNWVALALKQVDVGTSFPASGSEDGIAPFAGTLNVLDDQNTAFSGAPPNDLDPDFVNPAPYDEAIVMKFPCEENEDTSVVFNLTIMRDAEQGFFDIAVNFEDIFCSMKVDTCYEGGKAIELLFDKDGKRVETAVVGSACSKGTGPGQTVMWMAPLTVTCDGPVKFTIDPTGDKDHNPATPGEPGNGCTSVTTAGTTTGAAQATGGIAFLSNNALPTPGAICTVNGVSYELGASTQFNQSLTLFSGTAVLPGAAGNQDWQSTPTVISCNGTTYAETRGLMEFGSDGTTTGAATYELCYSLYWGSEDLLCGTPPVPCNKVYWNVAINIDQLRDKGLKNCRVKTAVTASSTVDTSPPLFVNGGLAGPGQSYGFVAFGAPLTTANGAPTCFQGPMGSDFAPVFYGTTSDILNGRPFPQLCYDFVQGGAPRILKDVTNYFKDAHSTAADARYAGKIKETSQNQFSTVDLAFDDMGSDVGTECSSGVRNLVEYIRFDLARPTYQLSWSGRGVLGGTYSLEVSGRKAEGAAWVPTGSAVTIDLDAADAHNLFKAGGVFSNAARDTQFLFKLTRTDTDFTKIYSLIFDISQAVDGT